MNTRMGWIPKRLGAAAAAGLLSLAASTTASALSGNVSTSPDISIALHGFINASFFYQDQNFVFGNGQNAEFPEVPATPGQNNGLSGGDVRNTRAWLDLTGPVLDNGWQANAHLEFDFFGGNNGTGAFSGQQPNPRLRLAYVDLANANTDTLLRLGQDWDLLFPASNYDKLVNLAPSLTHIAFPLGLGTGLIGWRYPGVIVSQGLGKFSPALQGLRLDLAAFSGNYAGPGSTINYQTAGNVNFHPQWEARLSFNRDNVLLYLAGKYESIKLTGVGGTAPAPIRDSLSTYAVLLGGKTGFGPLSVGLAGYVGRGVGNEFGQLVQFGDIRGVGGYAWSEYKLAGLGLTHWSVAGTYAIDKPNSGDVLTWVGKKGRVRNQQFAADLFYNNGPYGLGLEWMHSILRTWANSSVDQQSTVANQYSISAIYHF